MQVSKYDVKKVFKRQHHKTTAPLTRNEWLTFGLQTVQIKVIFNVLRKRICFLISLVFQKGSASIEHALSHVLFSPISDKAPSEEHMSEDASKIS